MSEYSDIFHHIYRERNEEADELTHRVREEGPTWSNFQGERPDAIRIFSGGVSGEEDEKGRTSSSDWVPDASGQ